MATTYLTRTPSSAGGQRTLTWSYWIKKNPGTPSSTYKLFDCGNSTNYFTIYFPDTHTLTVKGRLANSTVLELVTTQCFRDTGWYHFVITLDTTQASSSDRCKIYVNGTQITTFATSSYPSQDADFELQDTSLPWLIGCKYDQSAGEFFDGVMAAVECTDGTAYDASAFGSFNSTTGIWVPNTSPSVTYGTNGFKLDFANSSDMGNDVSGNANDFTVGGGTLTQTEDCASNCFPTFNPNTTEMWANKSVTLSDILTNGNTTFQTSSNEQIAVSTIGVTKGKFYWEGKIIDHARLMWGIGNQNMWLSSSNPPYDDNYDAVIWFYGSNGNINFNNGNSQSSGVTVTGGDILQCALDMDNYKLYFGKNGTWMNSGDPTSGSTGTGSITNLQANSDLVLSNYGPVFSVAADTSTSDNAGVYMNWGNGYFGSTAIASEGTNASGIGKFEYDVPTGYTAMSTKGLNN